MEGVHLMLLDVMDVESGGNGSWRRRGKSRDERCPLMKLAASSEGILFLFHVKSSATG